MRSLSALRLCLGGQPAERPRGDSGEASTSLRPAPDPSAGPTPRPASERASSPESDNASRVPAHALQRLRDARRDEQARELDALRTTAQAPALGGQETLRYTKIPHAAYLTARAIDGRRLEGADLELLRKADDAVIETRLALHHGRGNLIRPDDAQLDREARYRVQASRSFIPDLSDDPRAVEHHLAPVSMFARAGNCGEYASVAAHMLADKLADGETAHVVDSEHARIDHAFVEIRTPADRQQHAVVDPWSFSPAFMVPDGEVTGDQVPHSGFSIDAATGPAFAADVRATLATLSPAQDRELRRRVDDLRRANFAVPRSLLFTPFFAIGAAFAARVADKMDATVTPPAAPPETGRRWRRVLAALRREPERSDRMAPVRHPIVAVGVVRDMGYGVAAATREADTITAMARSLRTSTDYSN